MLVKHMLPVNVPYTFTMSSYFRHINAIAKTTAGQKKKTTALSLHRSTKLNFPLSSTQQVWKLLKRQDTTARDIRQSGLPSVIDYKNQFMSPILANSSLASAHATTWCGQTLLTKKWAMGRETEGEHTPLTHSSVALKGIISVVSCLRVAIWELQPSFFYHFYPHLLSLL